MADAESHEGRGQSGAPEARGAEPGGSKSFFKKYWKEVVTVVGVVVAVATYFLIKSQGSGSSGSSGLGSYLGGLSGGGSSGGSDTTGSSSTTSTTSTPTGIISTIAGDFNLAQPGVNLSQQGNTISVWGNTSGTNVAPWMNGTIAAPNLSTPSAAYEWLVQLYQYYGLGLPPNSGSVLSYAPNGQVTSHAFQNPNAGTSTTSTTTPGTGTPSSSASVYNGL